MKRLSPLLLLFAAPTCIASQDVIRGAIHPPAVHKVARNYVHQIRSEEILIAQKRKLAHIMPTMSRRMFSSGSMSSRGEYPSRSSMSSGDVYPSMPSMSFDGSFPSRPSMSSGGSYPSRQSSSTTLTCSDKSPYEGSDGTPDCCKGGFSSLKITYQSPFNNPAAFYLDGDPTAVAFTKSDPCTPLNQATVTANVFSLGVRFVRCECLFPTTDSSCLAVAGNLFERMENVLPGTDICLMYTGTVKFNDWPLLFRPSMIDLTVYSANLHVSCSQPILPPWAAVLGKCSLKALSLSNGYYIDTTKTSPGDSSYIMFNDGISRLDPTIVMSTYCPRLPRCTTMEVAPSTSAPARPPTPLTTDNGKLVLCSRFSSLAHFPFTVSCYYLPFLIELFLSSSLNCFNTVLVRNTPTTATYSSHSDTHSWTNTCNQSLACTCPNTWACT